jgi:hypothetical protein
MSAATSGNATFRTSQPDSGMSAVGGRAEVVIASPDFRVGPKPEVELANRPALPLAESTRLLGIRTQANGAMLIAGRYCFKNLQQPNHKNLCFREHRA